MAEFTVFQAATPALTDLDDADSYALGTVVLIGATDNGGEIIRARWYFPTTPPSGPVTWRVSDLDTLDLLGSHVFSGDGPGWVEEALASPVSIPPEGRNVLVWVGTPDAYVATTSYFTSGAGSAGITNGPLTAPASGSDPEGVGNGRFGGDPDSPPMGTISGGNYFADLVFEEAPEPPAEGVAALGLDLAVASSGEAPEVPPAEGVAALTLDLAVAGVGDAPAIDPGEGVAELGLVFTVSGVGETPEVTPNEGSAALGLALTVAATGEAPDPDEANGVAALGLMYTITGEGSTPTPGEASGTAALGLVLTVASSGLMPDPGGQSALGLVLTVAVTGSNGESDCRPVRSFSEVMS